ncbi:hypothetical protein CALVIDRAFT_455802, partial [Calocera viscosa TUFC12733]
CISQYGVGCLYRFFKSVKGPQYCDCLEDALLGTIEDINKSAVDIIYQQDGAPPHTSLVARAWLAERDIFTLSWLPNSCDLNIIEHVWHYLKHKVRPRYPKPKNIEDLWEVIEWEWYSIPNEFIAKLYDSMTRRCSEVYKAKG